MADMTTAEIQHAIESLRDPKVKYRVSLASTTEVARDIVDSLPGVRELKQGGPAAGKALLNLLQDEHTLQDSNLTAISLRILESHPTDEVKLALAKPISERRFKGLSRQFAADTFLRSAQIETDEDAVETAFREASHLQTANTPMIDKKE